jgi:hypothetical protein
LTKAPVLRPELEFLWSWFIDLASARQMGGMGSPQPLSFADIWSWCQLHAIALAPWQVRAIRLLDMNQLRIILAKDPPTVEDLE